MSARKMTQAEKEAFIERLCESDPLFESNYRMLVTACQDEILRETVAQWLIQSAHARHRRVRATC